MDLQTVYFEEEPDEKLRAASPSPPVPAPTAFGHELTIQEQFEYVKPVLIAILNGQHARPALQRHIAFMKGGRSRTQVSNSAWRRGEVSHHDRDELSRCVLRWMRRRQRRQELGFVPADDGVLVRDGGFPDGIEAVNLSACILISHSDMIYVFRVLRRLQATSTLRPLLVTQRYVIVLV